MAKKKSITMKLEIPRQLILVLIYYALQKKEKITKANIIKKVKAIYAYPIPYTTRPLMPLDDLQLRKKAEKIYDKYKW